MPQFDFYLPSDLKDALQLKESGGEGVVVVASGTDLMPRMRKGQVSPQILMSISSLENDLRYLRRENGVIHIGALATVSDLLDSPLFAERLSMISEAAENFGAPQIRNVATVGGNICSASSSEDFIPVLLALDSRVKLISEEGERSLALRDFVLGKRRTAMKTSEILSEVYFESPDGNSWSGFEKLGRRNILIVAMVGEALLLSLEDDLKTVKSAKIALNRLAGRIPAMAEKTTSFMTGRKLTDETIAEAQKVLASELALTSDFRGSAAYRVSIAQAYLRRLLLRCSRKIAGSA